MTTMSKELHEIDTNTLLKKGLSSYEIDHQQWTAQKTTITKGTLVKHSHWVKIKILQ